VEDVENITLYKIVLGYCSKRPCQGIIS